MNTFFTTLLIAISLSMDAFSLALIYGLQPINKKNKISLSFIVGLCHFFMPLIGLTISRLLMNYIIVDLNIIVAIIFIIIGIEMITANSHKQNQTITTNIIEFIIFGLSVSIDSLTTGIGLDAINKNYLQVCTTFAIISTIFTYSGLILGNILNEKYGKYSTITGGIILIILSIYYLF